MEGGTKSSTLCFWLVPWQLGFPTGLESKESGCNAGDQVQSLGQKDPLENGMATHSNILIMENPVDRGAWWATVRGVRV